MQVGCRKRAEELVSLRRSRLNPVLDTFIADEANSSVRLIEHKVWLALDHSAHKKDGLETNLSVLLIEAPVKEVIKRLNELISAQIVVESVCYRLQSFLPVLPLETDQLLDDVLGK